MSSRLLTMKFMQRAAASSPASSAASTPDHRSAKRQRLSNGSFRESPTGTPTSESETVNQVLAAEERKRQEAVDREAARRGETKWVLDVKTPSKAPSAAAFKVVSAGYSTLDAREAKQGSSDVDVDDDDDEDVDEPLATPMSGRLKFGTTTNYKGIAQDDEDEEDADADEQQSGRKCYSSDGKAGEAARQQRDAKRKQDQALSNRLAGERRDKQVNLNKLSSISGGGSGRASNNMICHQCGEAGHIKAKCPQRRRSNHR